MVSFVLSMIEISSKSGAPLDFDFVSVLDKSISGLSVVGFNLFFLLLFFFVLPPPLLIFLIFPISVPLLLSFPIAPSLFPPVLPVSLELPQLLPFESSLSSELLLVWILHTRSHWRHKGARADHRLVPHKLFSHNSRTSNRMKVRLTCRHAIVKICNAVFFTFFFASKVILVAPATLKREYHALFDVFVVEPSLISGSTVPWLRWKIADSHFYYKKSPKNYVSNHIFSDY